MDIANIGLGVVDTAYNMFANERARGDANRQFRQSMALQKDQFAWQKDMDQWNRSQTGIQREREDTAMQRHVADLQSAGLHKTLAAGGAGAASQPIQTHGQSGSSPSGTAPSRSELKASQILMNSSMSLDNKQKQATIDMTEAERSRILEDARRIRTDTDYIADRERRDESRHGRDTVEHQWRGETHRRELEHLQGRINMQPAEFADLIANTARTNIQTTESQLHTLQQRQEIAMHHYQERAFQLAELAAELNISRQELENKMLLHDAEILLNSDFTSDQQLTEGAIIESFVRGVLGNDVNPRARQIITSILRYGNYAGDLMMRAMAASGGRSNRRNAR